MQQSLFNINDNILPCQGEVFYYPDFFSPAENDHFLEMLTREISWKQEPIIMFGKKIMQPRLTALYGEADKALRYSGIIMHPQQWTISLLEIKNRVEAAAGTRFTSALLNLYRDGSDSMGWHRDNEKELGINPVIGSVSFGAKRIFQLRNYKEKSIVCSVELGQGSFLLMKGETQHYWEHRVPKSTKTIDPRINITFRVINC